MVEEKKQLMFKLRITKKKFIQVVEKYLPEEFGKMEKRVNHCEARIYDGKRYGTLRFSTDKYWCHVHLALYGNPCLWFKRWDEDNNKWVDCGMFHPDLEYLDLLGMIVKY